ncbi:hypothetical protein RND81_08G061100 [Saponaria officinalis]|uniref:ENT domain-containing protein n=1 Tax=Saponaria officinalis TaxID=3572 RepID=A0AAW1J4K2_SAPOF
MATKMRFKKGTKVEVSTLKEGPSRSWRCAEIIGHDSNRYTVRYEGDVELFGKARVERVSRKAIRPCPPRVDVLQDWVPGDVVEVLHDFSWKMATVLKDLGRDHVLIRLLGSAVEFEAPKYDGSDKREDLRFRFPSSCNANNQPMKMVTFVGGRTKVDYEVTKDTDFIWESQAMPLKRRISRVHSQAEAYARPHKKKAMHQSRLPKKVENVASSRELLHEKRMHPSLINGTYRSSKMFVELDKTVGANISLKSNDDDRSVSSSVGSCSVNRNPSQELRRVFYARQYEDNDSQCSDAESSSQSRSEEGNPILPTKDVLTDQIRRLELHAYRCTIGALYASGPLSWEQELLLTNLRDSLHISNDEHLAEIRNLVQSSICIPSS